MRDATGIEMIAMERERHVHEEGYDLKHDLQHKDAEIAWCAVAYAAPTRVYKKTALSSSYPPTIVFADVFPALWVKQDKRHIHPRIKQLVIAGALIAAEIDRIIEVHRLLKLDEGC